MLVGCYLLLSGNIIFEQTQLKCQAKLGYIHSFSAKKSTFDPHISSR